MSNYETASQFTESFGSVSESNDRTEGSSNVLPESSRMTSGSHDSVTESGGMASEFSVRSFRGLDPRIVAAIIPTGNLLRWDDVKGMADVKNDVYDGAILPFLRPELFDNQRKPAKGVLLYGPPGCGKTSLAKAVASVCDSAIFLSISAADITSKWMGESEGMVRQIFKFMRSVRQSILFVDEIDSLCASSYDSTTGTERRILTEFLVGMDSLEERNGWTALVISATNRPWTLDKALLRRFDKRIYVSIPSWQDRFNIITSLLREQTSEVSDLEKKSIASTTNGLSSADITSLVAAAFTIPLSGLQASTHFRKVTSVNVTSDGVYCTEPAKFMRCSSSDEGAIPMTLQDVPKGRLITRKVTMKDLQLAAAKIKSTIAEEDVEDLELFHEKYGTADSAASAEESSKQCCLKYCCACV